MKNERTGAIARVTNSQTIEYDTSNSSPNGSGFGSDSGSGAPNIFGEWWFWCGCAVAIAFFTHDGAPSPVIINNEAPPPIIINNSN